MTSEKHLKPDIRFLVSLYNTVALFGMESEFPLYRKVHLTKLGADRFVSRGNLGFPVYDLPFARVGMNICYDQRFPENARIMALSNVHIVIVPTSETMAGYEISDVLIRARAYVNRVYYLWANRVGFENGSQFDGSSRIMDPMGEIISLALYNDEEIIFADIDIALAEDKKTPVVPGLIEIDLIEDRAPECYGPLLNSHQDGKQSCFSPQQLNCRI